MRPLKIMLIILVASFATFLTAAQTDTVEFADGSTVTLPGGWKIVEQNDDYTDIENDREELTIRFYFYAADVLSGERVNNLEEFAEYDYNFYDASQDQPFSARDLQDSKVAGESAVQYSFKTTNDDGDEYEVILVYFMTADGAGLSAEVQPYFVDNTPDMDAVYAVLDTLTGAQDRRGSTRGTRSGGETQTVTLLDGTTLDVPSDWSVTEGDVNYLLFISSPSSDGVIEVRVEAGIAGFAEFNTPEKYLEYVMLNVYPRLYDRGEVQATQVAEFEAAQYDFVVEERSKQISTRFITTLLPNTNGISVFVRDSTDFDATMEVAQQILDSLVASDTTFCYVFAPNGVNLRSKASTSGTVVIKIDINTDTGETLTADYGTPDGNGAVWFHILEYDAFVRQDVVFFDNNSCGNLPVQ